MSLNAKVGRAAAVAASLVLLAALDAPPSAVGKLETWRQETASAFTKGHREGVVVSEHGRVRLGQSLSPIEKLDANRVWDLVRTPDGTVYAATGDDGKVFRREAKDDASWSVAYDAPDTQALSLAVLPEGRVVVGTGPS